MKKTIKIYFVGFWNNMDMENNIVCNVLKRHYDIVLDAQKPDYIFCSAFGEPYEYCKYDGIRIFCSGENYSPDFNVVDYAIGYDNLSYGDRFFRRIFITMKHDATRYDSLIEQLKDRPSVVDGGTLASKDKFCNLIYSHERDDFGRKRMLETLSAYKRVDSAGTYLNNMSDGMHVTRDTKLAFQTRYKFTIAFESVNMHGFFTEKIVDAFLANTIPIYMGDPDISTIFNSKAFINCDDYDSVEEVLEKVKELDNNDELYLQMLQEPIFAEGLAVDGYDERFEAFLIHIFEQDKENAYRRARGLAFGVAKAHEERLVAYSELEKRANRKPLIVRMRENGRRCAGKVKRLMLRREK